MSRTDPPKIDGISQMTGAQHTAFLQQVESVITDAGGTLIETDSLQFRQAINSYASIANFYIDTGTATEYVLNPQGSFKSPIDAPSTWNGMLIRFRPTNNNIGVATLRLAGLNGGLPFNILRENGTAIQANDLSTDREAILRYDLTASAFLLSTVPNASETVAGIIKTATTTQMTNGEDDTVSVTPAKLNSYISGLSLTRQETIITSGSGTNCTGYTRTYNVLTGQIVRKKVFGRTPTIPQDGGINILFPLTFTNIYSITTAIVASGGNIDATPDSPEHIINLSLTGMRVSNADQFEAISVIYTVEGD